MPAPPRARTAVVALLLLVLAACGSPPAADRGATRTIPDATGPVDVPVSPQRVVVLEPVLLDTAVALGLVPVGTTVLSEGSPVPPYLGEAAARAAVVGTTASPDLERIAALGPDLILGTASRHADLRDRLAAIAPTAFLRSQADPWQDNVRFAGRALGREGDTERLLGAYRDRCASVAASRATAGRTAQIIRPRGAQLTLYGPTSFAGSTLQCAGLTIPPQDWGNSISVDLSPELASRARADTVFVTAADPASPTAIPPTVATLGPQLAPRLYPVDQSYWITGVGPLGGQRVLDDLERLLIPS